MVREQSPGGFLLQQLLSVMVKSCYRRAILSTRDYPQGCQLHSCERLHFGVASDFGSLLRVVFDAAALLLRSYSY